MDEKLIEHVALAVEPELPGAYFTTCEKVARVAIEAVNSYKHTDYDKTDEQGRPLTYWGGLKDKSSQNPEITYEITHECETYRGFNQEVSEFPIKPTA